MTSLVSRDSRVRRTVQSAPVMGSLPPAELPVSDGWAKLPCGRHDANCAFEVFEHLSDLRSRTLPTIRVSSNRAT